MSDLVFLGAGASRPFEVPTMQEMVTEFEKDVEKEQELFNYYSKIKKTLIDTFGSSNVDIEAMLSVVEGITERTSAKELGHFAFYYISKTASVTPFDPKEVELAKKLLEKLKDYIKDSCTVKLSPTECTKIYEKSYVPLYNILKGPQQRFFDKYDLTNDSKSYTTNYDNIFESFWNRLLTPEDHFDKIQNTENYVFHTKKLVLGKHSFVKLHGSLDWTKNKESGDIIRKNTSSFQPVETEGDVMLYPIQQKDLYFHPWYSLFSDFKMGLIDCGTWYVVGYAFNDEFITNAFIEQLKLRKKPTLVIISPSAKGIIRKFPKEVRDKIILLPIKFGTKYFPKQISDFAEGVRTLSVKVLTSSPIIGFKSSLPIESGTITKINDDVKHIAMTTHSNNKFIETHDGYDDVGYSNDYKEVEMELKFQHVPPFDKDLELQIYFQGVYDYEFLVYFEDRFLGSKKGNTPTQDDDYSRHSGESVKIYHNSLFVSF